MDTQFLSKQSSGSGDGEIFGSFMRLECYVGCFLLWLETGRKSGGQKSYICSGVRLVRCMRSITAFSLKHSREEKENA